MAARNRNRLNLEHLEAREVPTAAGLYAVGAGPGVGSVPRVQVFDTQTGARLADFLAYEPVFTGGVSVAVADVNSDGFPDVIVAAGEGGGPRVRVIDGRAFRGVPGFPQAPNNGTAVQSIVVFADFFAFEEAQRGGAYVTGGNIIGSFNADIVVGAGPGGGPRVRIFDGLAVTTRGKTFNGTQAGDVAADFFAFDSNFRNGVTVSLSPTFSGGTGQYLVVAPGSGGSPRVRVLSGPAIAQQGIVYNSFRPGDVFADFFAGNPNARGGAFVATADFDRDGFPDVAVGTGAGSIGGVTVYSGSAISLRGVTFNGAAPGDVLDAFPVAGANYTNGVTVGATSELSIPTQGLLFYGFGGQGLTGRAVLVRYQFVSGGLTRQVVDEINFDGSQRNVFVSN